MYTLTTNARPAVLDCSDREEDVMTFRKTGHPRNAEEGQGYEATEVADTLNVFDNTEARTPTLIYDARGNGDGETVPTLTGDHYNRITDYTAICIGNGQTNLAMGDVVGALNCMHDQQALMTEGESENPVRRLTPLEAERCQGLPDGWSDIGEYTDTKGKKQRTTASGRYGLLGNGIALPFWTWLLRRIGEHCDEKTMGSLFNGGGSFPLIWQVLYGEGSCRWVSEIAEFPIAVTKRHFGDEAEGTTGDWKNYVHDKGSEE